MVWDWADHEATKYANSKADAADYTMLREEWCKHYNAHYDGLKGAEARILFLTARVVGLEKELKKKDQAPIVDLGSFI